MIHSACCVQQRYCNLSRALQIAKVKESLLKSGEKNVGPSWKKNCLVEHKPP